MHLFLMFYKTSKAHMWTWQADQMYSRGSCKKTTFWIGVSARAADGDETPPLPGFATASHIKGVTITASRGANTCTFNLRNNEMARMAGLEPATAALTVRCPTIELHPNLYRQHPNGNELRPDWRVDIRIGGGSRIRTDVLQVMGLPLVPLQSIPLFHMR